MEALRTHGAIDHLCVPSKASRKVLRDQGFRRITVIPHGISLALTSFHEDTRVLNELRAKAGARLILCPVRADEHKDPQTFVRAAGIVKERLPNLPLVFALTCGTEGDDGITEEFADELKAIASIRKLREGTDLLFTRHFSYGDELYTAYTAAEIVVVPSIRESFGQAVLDGFMFKKPVVARNSMALQETVRHLENGLLFDTTAELATHIERLLLDSNLADRLAQQGARDLEGRFEITAMAKSYRALYQRVVDDRGERLGRRFAILKG